VDSGQAGPQGPWNGRRIFLAVLVGVWLLSGIYLVGPDQQAVVTHFGRVVDNRVMPGIHYIWPYPIGQVHKLKVLQRQRAFIGGAPADQPLGQVEPRASQFLSGDQNLINVRTVVQFSVATPDEYLFRAEDVGRAVGAAVESELARQIASRNVDDVLTTEKVAIQEAVRQRSQVLVDQYGLGVVLSTVNIEYIAPPQETAAAFRDVASARADSVRITNEAQGYANDLVPRARGEARTLTEAAHGYKQRKVNEALGDASRFTQLVQEYEKAPAVTRSRLFLETMEEVLPRLKKTIVDSEGSVDMTIIRRNSTKRAPESRLPPATTAFPAVP
jgi:membrane protease subunit HflK